MVLLTMTPSIVEGLQSLPPRQPADDDATNTKTAPEPSLAEPAVGKPISHSQIVDLRNSLKESASSPATSLEQLLRGSNVYVPPPPPKPEPTPEYKALMARLRREEEARSYERMLNPNIHTGVTSESFYDRFPHASARAFAAVNQPSNAVDTGDDEGVTYQDIHRQVLLILNFMVSILGVGGTLWVLARWWSLPARLFLTMGGSLVVGIAEVAIYSIWVWKMGDAKQRQEAVKEVKEVVDSWVVGEDEKKDIDDKAVLIGNKEEDTDGVRKRTTGKKDAQ